MRDYGAVSPRFWIGETGKRLRGDANAQVLAIYLMTSPHATMTGVYHCPVLYMAHETGLSIEGATKALERLSEEGFVEYDAPSEYVFVVNMAFWQIGESLKANDNRISGLKRDVEKMHKRFKHRFLQVYSVAFHLEDQAKEVSPSKAPCKPLPSQDQDQDQDQEVRDVELPSAPQPNGHQSAIPTDVTTVFNHWRVTWSHEKAKLDTKREKAIRRALKSYDVTQLCTAISGYRNSPHHRGENDSNTPYDDVELFLRDAKRIEAGIKFAEKGQERQWT